EGAEAAVLLDVVCHRELLAVFAGGAERSGRPLPSGPGPDTMGTRRADERRVRVSDTALIQDVTEATFEQEVLEASRRQPVVVDFWADWCGPCHQLAPLLERAAAKHAGEVSVRKLDVDAAPGLARRYGVQGIPAVKAFRDGAVVSEFVGVQPATAVDSFFAAL